MFESNKTDELITSMLQAIGTLPTSYRDSELPNQVDNIVSKFIMYLASGPVETRRAFAEVADDQIKRALRDFIFRVSIISLREHSPAKLKQGYAALGLSGMAADVEDLYSYMAILNHSAEQLNVDPIELFEFAASLTNSSELRTRFLSFANADPIYKKLETFYLREIKRPNGIIYWTTRNNRIPTNW